MSYTFDQTTLSPIHGISLAGSGCGPCSLASIVYNDDRAITPYKTAEYLYSIGAFGSYGTTRAGMSKAIQHYGFKSTYYTPEHAGGTVWKEAMKQIQSLADQDKDFWAIFLVVGTVNGAKDNYWTSGGHFLAITDYNNNGLLYVRDSGAKKRTGYHHPSELQFDTNCIWVIEKMPVPEPYSGKFPTVTLKKGIDEKKQVKRLQLFLNWYFEDETHLKVDGDFGNKTLAAVKKFQEAEELVVDGIFGPKSRAKAKMVKR